jgi:hypothetical protein
MWMFMWHDMSSPTFLHFPWAISFAWTNTSLNRPTIGHRPSVFSLARLKNIDKSVDLTIGRPKLSLETKTLRQFGCRQILLDNSKLFAKPFDLTINHQQIMLLNFNI